MKKIFRLIKTHYHKPLLVFALLTLWQLGVMLFQVKEYIIPSPLAVLARIIVPEMAGKYHWLKHIYATFVEIFFGFAITAFLGVFLAVLISWSKRIRDLLPPFFVFINSLPIIAVAPIFLLWMGYGDRDQYHDRLPRLFLSDCHQHGHRLRGGGGGSLNF